MQGSLVSKLKPRLATRVDWIPTKRLSHEKWLVSAALASLLVSAALASLLV